MKRNWFESPWGWM